MSSVPRLGTTPDEAGQSVRIARLLGMRSPASLGSLELADRIAAGLAPSAANAIARVLGSSRVIGPIVPEATLRRAKANGSRLSREHSERLYWIGRVIDELHGLYRGDDGAAIDFLTHPHPSLEDRTPLDVARASSAGAETVLNLIGRIRWSMPV